MPRSVTEVECACEYLKNGANDPDMPIIFDPVTNEYQFEYEERQPSRIDLLWRVIRRNLARQHAVLIIYHCPWCGGAAPKSKRGQLFHAISHDEQNRIADILSDIHTHDQSIKVLGPPDFETQAIVKTPEKGDAPPKIECYRELVYQRLSDVAEVRITEGLDGKVYWQLHGKYKGQATDAQ